MWKEYNSYIEAKQSVSSPEMHQEENIGNIVSSFKLLSIRTSVNLGIYPSWEF